MFCLKKPGLVQQFLQMLALPSRWFSLEHLKESRHLSYGSSKCSHHRADGFSRAFGRTGARFYSSSKCSHDELMDFSRAFGRTEASVLRFFQMLARPSLRFSWAFGRTEASVLQFFQMLARPCRRFSLSIWKNRGIGPTVLPNARATELVKPSVMSTTRSISSSPMSTVVTFSAKPFLKITNHRSITTTADPVEWLSIPQALAEES